MGRAAAPRRSRTRLSDVLDRGLTLLKWPVALVALALLPGLVLAFGRLVGAMFAAPGPILPFLAGFGAYFVLWLLLLRRPAWGSLLSTFEHELTHALFAWATAHRVTGLRTSWRGGGEVRFRGRGNWLITIAPYFFPTVSLLLLVVLALVPGRVPLFEGALLGITVAYHATSTWLETHRRQPDLAKVTFPFAFAFLPSANLASYGLLVAFAHEGTAAAGRFLARGWELTTRWLGGAAEQLLS
jgi:hypothetical protein